jgi:uncharacterized protein with GYD domain
MATFAILIKLTDQGAAGIKDAPERMRQAFESMTALGATVKDFYVTMGEYDYVGIGEGPDDETAMAACAALAASGNVRTTSMRAFTPQEFGAIVARLAR